MRAAQVLAGAAGADAAGALDSDFVGEEAVELEDPLPSDFVDELDPPLFPVDE